MDSRKRNRKIVFQRGIPTEDQYGGEILTWQDFCTEWAAVIFGTGQERRAAAQEQATLPATFQVLRNSKTATLTPKDRILFDGVVWGITSAVPSKEFNAGIDVTAIRSA